jgi:enoyl-CoA hydratase/carnithine racemase
MTTVRLERDGGVWRLVLDRPPANALDLDLATAFGAAVAEVERSDACRAVVVTGGGLFFSAGIDVKAVPAYDAATRAAMLRAINATIARLYGLPKPTVAALNGHALGGALVAALACDVRIAAAGTYRLGLTESAAGIPFPAVPLRVVEAEVTSRSARLATVASEVLDPAGALAVGFVDTVVEPDALLGAATKRAEALAVLPAFAAVKRQLRRRALDDMRAIVEGDAEPMLAGWI